MRILLMIKNAKLLEDVCSVLVERGYEYKCFSSATEVAQERNGFNNAIIIDELALVEENDQGGLNYICKTSPALIVLESPTPSVLADYYERGFVDYLSTPIVTDEIINRLHLAAKRKQVIKNREEYRYTYDNLLISYQALFENTPDAIAEFDMEHNIIDVNPQFTEMFGYERVEAVGKYINSIIDPDNKLKQVGSYRILNGEVVLFEDTVRYHKNGSAIAVILKGIPLKRDGKVIGGCAIYTDITARKQLEEKNEYLAYHDPLTGVKNSRSLNKDLNEILDSGKRKGALMLIDVDRFKNINDTLGHQYGDILLQELAERIQKVIPQHSIYRPGGDEFVVLVDNEEQVDVVVEAVMQAIRLPFKIVNRDVIVTVSIGVSHYPEDGHDINELFSKADIAMYKAKDLGKNRYCFYSKDMGHQLLYNFDLENELRKALELQEFELYYQPQVNIKSREIVGLEALLRWNNHLRGIMIRPDDFIPLAEETGLILPIGKWVLHHACQQNKIWQEQGYKKLPIAVNVSPLQFNQDDFIEEVRQVLKDTGLEASYLDLEITETTAMTNIEEVEKKILELRAMGVMVSIDDFGTGYSSLSNFRKLPINKLKIDKSFIARIPEDSKDASIVDTIIAMAQRLGLELIAEGVETEAHMNYLSERNSILAQGYLYSKPMQQSEIVKLLQLR